MKRIWLVAVVLLVSFSSCNQGTNKKAGANSQPERAEEEILTHPKFDASKIHGLGLFKIGASVDSTIGQLVRLKGFKLDTIKNFEQEMQAEEVLMTFKLIFKLDPSASTTEVDVGKRRQPYYKSLWCKRLATYNINGYEVDKMLLDKMVVKYYDNKLVYVECTVNGGEIVPAITLKYGQPTSTGSNPDGETEGAWYDNDDVAAGFMPGACVKVYIKGEKDFINACGEKDFAAQDVIDKSNKAKSLKNL